MRTIRLLVSLCLLSMPGLAWADGIGVIKKLAGGVQVERNGQKSPATLGMAVQQQDILITGADGSFGILFADDSRMSAGPNSRLALNEYRFDDETDDGHMDASFLEGVFSVVAGKITRKNPDALKVRTPSAVLAVRGTEFSVKVEHLGDGGAAR